MRRFIFILVIFIFFENFSFSQEANGRTWREFNRYLEAKKIKSAFLKGFYEGLLIYNYKDIKNLFPSYSENLIDLLNKFYSDEKNLNIPITYALYIIGLQTRGESKDKIEEYLKKIRSGLRLDFKELK